MPAPCLAAGSLRKPPSASPNAKPQRPGPVEPSPRATHRPAATARLAKGPRSLRRIPKQAKACSSGRAIQFRDLSPRTARLPAGASVEPPSYRQLHPLPSQRKQRLDRLTSRPRPTLATAIARQRKKEAGRTKRSVPPCRRPLRPMPVRRTLRPPILHRWRRQKPLLAAPAIPGAFTPLPASPLPDLEFLEARTPARMRTKGKLPPAGRCRQCGWPG